MSLSSISSTGSNYLQMPPIQDTGAMQTSLMQALSGLFAALAPFFQSEAQNSQFSPNQPSQNIGNALPMGWPMGPSTQPSTQPMTQDRATGLVNRNFDNLKGGDSTVDRADLRRAQSDPNTSAEMKDAASFLLDNPNAFAALETADARASGKMSGLDGRISKGDVNAAQVGTQEMPGERSAIETLLRHKDLLGGDGLISQQELSSIAAGGSMPNGSAAPPDVQEAARTLTRSPEIFNKLDDSYMVSNPGADGQRGDKKIGLQDLLTAISK